MKSWRFKSKSYVIWFICYWYSPMQEDLIKCWIKSLEFERYYQHRHWFQCGRVQYVPVSWKVCISWFKLMACWCVSSRQLPHPRYKLITDQACVANVGQGDQQFSKLPSVWNSDIFRKIHSFLNKYKMIVIPSIISQRFVGILFQFFQCLRIVLILILIDILSVLLNNVVEIAVHFLPIEMPGIEFCSSRNRFFYLFSLYIALTFKFVMTRTWRNLNAANENKQHEELHSLNSLHRRSKIQ